jgi:hypothetical protein
MLGETSSLGEFNAIIDKHRSLPENQQEIADHEAASLHHPLRTPSRNVPARAHRELSDENMVKRLADKMIEALGLPPERRGNVEDDFRKEAKIEAVQQDYCKHLQPVQNNEHLLSPRIAYARPTRYTCSCTLLGYRTRIENEDIDTVINAMQRVYCEGCDKREPRNYSA